MLLLIRQTILTTDLVYCRYIRNTLASIFASLGTTAVVSIAMVSE